MLAEWDKLKLPGPEQGGSDWILSESPNQWHTWGVLLQPEMVLPLAGQN